VSDVVAQGAHPDDGSPVLELVVGLEKLTDFVVAVVVLDEHVEDATGEVHDAEAVLEAPVSGAGVDEIRESELMDVSQTLKRPGIDDPSLIGRDPDEGVDRVADLVLVLWRGHARILTSFRDCTPEFHSL
jgi:hypothetical protein